jgi:hypothetical protein
MELLTLKPLRHQDTIDIDLVALDDSGATLTCTVQLTKDLSDILSVVPDEGTPMTEALLEFARAKVREHLKTHATELAAMLAG